MVATDCTQKHFAIKLHLYHGVVLSAAILGDLLSPAVCRFNIGGILEALPKSTKVSVVDILSYPILSSGMSCLEF